jgi:hypothetical protein
MKTQTKKVLAILKKRSLTPAEARERVGTDRLAARIWEIRQQFGHASVEKRTEVNASGRHARYFWRGEAA